MTGVTTVGLRVRHRGRHFRVTMEQQQKSTGLKPIRFMHWSSAVPTSMKLGIFVGAVKRARYLTTKPDDFLRTLMSLLAYFTNERGYPRPQLLKKVWNTIANDPTMRPRRWSRADDMMAALKRTTIYVPF